MDSNKAEEADATIEWFGATTYRLQIAGLTIFLDTWLDRPSVLPHYISTEDVTKADYICISHAHFDHLPGADRLALRTGALVIANHEAIHILREAGVPDSQLIPVSGGERVPLFSSDIRKKAAGRLIPLAPGPPGAPPLPENGFATMAIDVWPSLHCLMPQDHPNILDTGTVHSQSNNTYASTLDISRGMKFGLLKLADLVPAHAMDDGMRSFVSFLDDPKNKFSCYDGGQLMFNLRFNNKAILWNAHLGAYKGILQNMEPKPNLAILGAAGLANLDGRPFIGSAAEFLRNEVEWLNQPDKVIWCLHDESAIKPYRVDTKAATELVQLETKTRVWSLEPGTPYQLFT